MSVQFGTFITTLANRVGLDTTSENFTQLLSANLQIPEDVANKIYAGSLNVESAVANKDVRSRIIAEVLNPVDKELLALAKDLGVEEESITEITTVKETRGKISKLQEVLKSSLEKQKDSSSKEDKSALQKQVDDLNQQIKALKQTSKDAEDKLRSTHELELNDMHYRSLLSGKKYAMPEETPLSDKVDFALMTIKNSMTADGYKVVSENGKRVLRKEDGTKAFDENQNEITLENYVDSKLAERKLLAVSPPAPQEPTGSQFETPPAGKDENFTPNTEAIDKINASLKDLGMNFTD